MTAKHNKPDTPWLQSLAILLFWSVTPLTLAGELEVLVTDASGQPVPEAVIEIISPVSELPADWPLTGAMDQMDKEFIGPLLMVVKNSLVSFPNSDDIHHHVYSFSETKRFELPLYTGNTADPVLFDNAGVVVIGCNIHDWMVGYIYVGETHLMAMSDSTGKAVLSDLPAGDYTFKVWHVRGRANELTQTYTATIGADGSTSANVQLSLMPDRRIRRAPTSGGTQY
jgi:hypothetical protein